MIIFYDKNMEELPEIDFIEASWNRKWKEPGNFTIYTTVRNWNPKIKFVRNTSRPEIGIIQKKTIESKVEGMFITASGYFAERALFWMVARNSFNIHETSDIAIKLEKIIRTNAYRDTGEPYENFVADLSINNLCKLPQQLNISCEEKTNIGEVVYNYLVENGYSCSVSLKKDHITKRLKYDLTTLKSRDLTNKVYFGNGFENVSKMEYVYDDSGAIPYVEIRQTMETIGFSDEIVILDDSGNKKGRIKEFVFDKNNIPLDVGVFPKIIVEGNVSGIKLEPANEKKIREQLKQQARLEMLNNYKIETIAADVLQNNFYYLKDYDLGDTCTIVFDEIKRTFTNQIMEIDEVFSKNNHKVKLIFGTPRKIKYVKINV